MKRMKRIKISPLEKAFWLNSKPMRDHKFEDQAKKAAKELAARIDINELSDDQSNSPLIEAMFKDMCDVIKLGLYEEIRELKKKISN